MASQEGVRKNGNRVYMPPYIGDMQKQAKFLHAVVDLYSKNRLIICYNYSVYRVILENRYLLSVFNVSLIIGTAQLNSAVNNITIPKYNYVPLTWLCVYYVCPLSLDSSQLCVIPHARWESVSLMTLANVLADTVGLHAAFQVFPCTVYTRVLYIVMKDSQITR